MRRSRWKAAESRGEVVTLPPLEEGEFLHRWLLDVGPVGSGGMGVTGLSWSEIAAWSHLAARPLDPADAETLHMLSAEYAHAYQTALEPDAPPHWWDREAARQADLRALRSTMDQVVAPKPGKPRLPRSARKGG